MNILFDRGYFQIIRIGFNFLAKLLDPAGVFKVHKARGPCRVSIECEILVIDYIVEDFDLRAGSVACPPSAGLPIFK